MPKHIYMVRYVTPRGRDGYYQTWAESEKEAAEFARFFKKLPKNTDYSVMQIPDDVKYQNFKF